MTPTTLPAAVPAASVGLPPRWRAPLLVLGFVALAVGSGAGLARLGWTVPTLMASAAAVHAPLMICAFFGVVISLERAVAIVRRWAYFGPLFAGLGGICAIAGEAMPAAVLFLAASVVLLGASLDVWRRQSALFTAVLVIGAACWVVGDLLWLLGWPVARVIPWWFAFLILTIAGERLELSRFMPRSVWASRGFVAVLTVILGGLLVGLLDGQIGSAFGAVSAWGSMAFAAGLLALAVWLFRHDIARRTVRSRGLTRFIAACLLSGYAWLAIGAATWLGSGGLQPGSASYDAALHALAIGFVFSMVFGHAPIIFPAVLRVAVPYHPSFYLPLALLHGSLALRVIASATGRSDALQWGGLLNVVALIAFIVGTASAVARRPRSATVPIASPRGRSTSSKPPDPVQDDDLRHGVGNENASRPRSPSNHRSK